MLKLSNNCLFCKQEYTKTGKNQKFCSDRCLYKNRYEKNKEQILAHKKSFYESNKTKINSQKTIYKRSKRLDPNYKLIDNLRSRLNKAIKGDYKSGSAISDLGCSITELKIYLQSKFQDGMSWDNYGQWHIDHIKPLISFDLANKEELKQACHFTNLQPLWAKDNISKSHKDKAGITWNS